MDLILKQLETANKTNSKSSFNYTGINLISYIATLEDNITSSELETVSKVLYYGIIDTFENSNEGFIQTAKENDKNNCLILPISNNDKLLVYVHNKWLFQVILLGGIKYLNVLNSREKINSNCTEFLHIIMSHIINYISIDKAASIHLLRTLSLILNKRSCILTPQLRLMILKSMNKLALSPISFFKQYVHSISKIVLPTLHHRERSIFLNIDMLPIRGINTFEVVKLFPKGFIKENIRRIIGKVLKLFLNNVESKDGGVLYESLLFYSFDEWRDKVWPWFLDSLKSLEYEGEYFQSLLKYWIPSNISSYRQDFYMFVKDENIDNKVKACILLESKKRGFISYGILSNDNQVLYSIEAASSISLKIVSTYHKKSLRPGNAEMSVLLNYLYANLNKVLIDDEIKSLYLFFSQIFLHSHVDLKKNKDSLLHYNSFLESIYKYCCGCLESNNFEIGAAILFILWNISRGSCRSLKLAYRIDERDMYGEGENMFYNELIAENLWKFHNDEVYDKLKKCYVRNNGDGAHLSKLLTLCADEMNFINVKGLRPILYANTSATLQNTERIKNYVDIILKNPKYNSEITVFLEEIAQVISSNLDLTQNNYSDENILYKNSILFEIILVAIKHGFEINKLPDNVEKALNVISHIVMNNFSGDGVYRTTKVLEAFINSIMNCMIQNKDTLWPRIDKEGTIHNLIAIIQRSNMKRPVSLAVEVLKQLGSKMEDTEVERNLKIQILDSTLKSIYTNPVKKMKIRRSPESRLIIHAMCSSEKTQTKPLLNWALGFLLNILANSDSSDNAIASALHSIEILVSDSSLQTVTQPFMSDICVKCVELFSNTSWIVRNADVQLAKALIERFYGVSLNGNNRPKNVEDLFLLLPELSVYFLKILSLETLDERSIVVFQFFFESQIRDQTFQHEIVSISRDSFLAVFSDIIKKYPNNYGKLAARSFAALCVPKEIPNAIVDITEFLKDNFKTIQKNIFANFAFLLQELSGKYEHSDYSSDDCCFVKINLAVNDLLEYLRQSDTALFNFILMKVKTVDFILEEFSSNKNGNGPENRIWLHNNLPFVIINSKPEFVARVLNKILTKELLGCIQIKILSILIRRLENNEFNNENMCSILEILFTESIFINNSENYLLNCYYRTILIFWVKHDNVRLPQLPFRITLSPTDNLYKIMIFVVYFSKQKCEQEKFYDIVETRYMEAIGTDEGVSNDILSTLRYFKEGAPRDYHPAVFRLAFYGAIHSSTHLEAYDFISWVTGRTFSSFLSALKTFLTVKTLMEHLTYKSLVDKFLMDVYWCVESLPDDSEGDGGYYAVESDYFLPKLLLKKLLKFSVLNT